MADRVAREGDEILNWIAAQPWSDGNIGHVWRIVGGAQPAGNRERQQFPPEGNRTCRGFHGHVRLCFYRGVVYHKDFLSVCGESTSQLEPMITPVASDDGTLLAQALEEGTAPQLARAPEAMRDFPYGDCTAVEGESFWDDFALYPKLELVNQSGVAV